MGTPNPVAHPSNLHRNKQYLWTSEEVDFLEKKYVDPNITTEEIQQALPWRSLNAIWLKANRLGLEIKWRTA